MLILPLKIVPPLLFSETISFEGESTEGRTFRVLSRVASQLEMGAVQAALSLRACVHWPNVDIVIVVGVGTAIVHELWRYC